MSEKIYKHSFQDGDIVTDDEFREIFTFLNSRDGFRANLNPGVIRLATEQEKQMLKDNNTEDMSF